MIQEAIYQLCSNVASQFIEFDYTLLPGFYALSILTRLATNAYFNLKRDIELISVKKKMFAAANAGVEMTFPAGKLRDLVFAKNLSIFEGDGRQ